MLFVSIRFLAGKGNLGCQQYFLKLMYFYFLRSLPNLIYATIIFKQEPILKAVTFRTGPVSRALFDIHTGGVSKWLLQVLILSLNDIATQLLKPNCLKRVLRVKRVLWRKNAIFFKKSQILQKTPPKSCIRFSNNEFNLLSPTFQCYYVEILDLHSFRHF